jgi:hypothetical protein
MSESATATFVDTQTSPGVYQYTITLTDTGTTPIGTFWFAWDDVPDQDFMSQIPTNVGAPAGWAGHVTTHPTGTGYGIEWNAGTPINPGGSSSAFTFTSMETPAQLAAVSPFDSTFQSTSSFVYQGLPFASPGGNLIVTPAASNSGLISNLSVNQQLELIYVAYFNRSADSGGATFWGGQNTQAQTAGQSAAIALTNIANSFTPQAETIALYPFLGTPNLNLSTPAAQTGLSTFIDSVYNNMFGRAADAPGKAFWVGQVTSGAVGLGAAALAIANGATGADAIEVQNKITVALDFTSRTGTAGIGVTSAPAAFLTAAHSVLTGVDGASLNDASVTAGMGSTTAFLSANGHATASATSDPITISLSNSVIDPGPGNHTISFLAGASADTLVLHANGEDVISGFDPGSGVLDLRSLLSEANVSLNGDIAALNNYVAISNVGSDALVGFDPTGHGGGTTVAVLQGLGNSSMDALVARGAIRIA